MHKRNTSSKNETSRTSAKSQQRPHFSKAMLTIAKTNLKEFESQTDEAFLIRADMERKLSSL
ncbi:hypothetical protein [uncultured Legionella sp.]|uniref:hypothetical protein n=1 Tax=uncultured Legionella sp. TaxID=210934 RepID=UPI002630625A|nr:hypothetical protein [uncultured Legionella sp.]